MPLTQTDRNLLRDVLGRAPGAWPRFVDRYAGLVAHVLDHLQDAWSIRLTPEVRAAVFGEVFQTLLSDEMQLLRHHDRKSSLATYLVVVVRRVAGRKLLEFEAGSRFVP